MTASAWKFAVALGGIALLAAALLFDRGGARAPLTHEAYVWQRSWDDSLRNALVDSRSLLQGLRVLGLQFDTRTQWNEAAVDLPSLATDGRDVVLVLRIDGAALLVDADAVFARLATSVAVWRAAGVRLQGVEIDHDCATARLADYALWLHTLRTKLPAELRLSITALPDWRSAPALEDVLSAVDASVLQVHAVENPQGGLFDQALARRWIADWALRSPQRPFYVALPAYGLRLHLDEHGALAGVEAEQTFADAGAGREIGVDPIQIDALLRDLESARYASLRGIVWFRLPRAADQRAWAMQTLRSVITHQALRAQLHAELKPRGNDAADLQLRNTGNLPADLPAVIEAEGSCASGDGVNGYRYIPQTPGARFERSNPGILRVGRSLVVGWLHCAFMDKVHVKIR